MQLVNVKETFERTCPLGDEPYPVFTLRKLTYGEMATIGDETSLFDDQNRIVYKGGTTGRLKIKFSVVAWKNITDETGKEVICNEANKEKLPIEVASWIVQEIDKLNRIDGIGKEERKNS